MGFDAAALRGGLDAWRRKVGDAAVPRLPEPADSVIERA
jgi:hypothetical protein